MRNNFKKISFLAIILTLLFSESVLSQQTDSLYRLELNFSLGPSYYMTDMEYEGARSNHPFVFTFEAMWHPEHILSVGISSGYLPLYSLKSKFYDTVYGDTKAELSLNSIPIIAVFSMEPIENFELFAGLGGFVLLSDVTSFDNEVSSTSWSNAYLVGCSYRYPVYPDFKLGAEAKAYYTNRLENFNLFFGISGKWTFYTY